MNNVKKIKEIGRITYQMKEEFFRGMNVLQIRNKCEELGIDRHIPIELYSTEIAVVTPSGVLMQIRHDDNKLGLWGGMLECNETPIVGAIREFREETGLEIDEEKFEFVDEYDHTHEYSNGDKAILHTYRFKVCLNYIPSIQIDEESDGYCIVSYPILSSQQDFVEKMLLEAKNRE